MLGKKGINIISEFQSSRLINKKRKRNQLNDSECRESIIFSTLFYFYRIIKNGMVGSFIEVLKKDSHAPIPFWIDAWQSSLCFDR